MLGGKFITFEGIDGAGKSTIIQSAKKNLEEQGIPVVLTREPGGTPIAESIRALLISDALAKCSGETEALMMFAARFEHLQKKIIPALQQGKWVLCDRFTDSTFAYQAFGRGVSQDFVNQLKSLVHANYQPDMTLLLDISTVTSYARLSQKLEEQNRLDSHADNFQQRVREGYLHLAHQYPQRIKLIKADQAIENVVSDVVEQLDSLSVRS